jgi:hypothetical protein
MKKLLIVLTLFGAVYFGMGLLNAGTYKKCAGYSGREKQRCWKSQFEETLESKGVKAGFGLLNNLYTNDPEFASSCHDYTHLIGESAYKEYAEGKKVDIGSQPSWCGYGFYHGFIISLFKDGKGKAEAVEFCRSTDKTSGLDCFHGMGHGFVDFNSDQLKSVNDIQIVISQGLSLCRDVTEDESELVRCKDGVFHSIFDVAVGEAELLSILVPKNDPFFYCKKQDIHNRSVCLGAMSTVIMAVSKNDFLVALDLVSRSLNHEDAALVIRQMSGYEAYRSLKNEGDLNSDVIACKGLVGILKNECLKGLVEGVADFGEPGREEYGVIDFCNNRNLGLDEKDFCFRHAVEYFGGYFGEEKRGLLCNLIDNKYCINMDE